MVFVALNALALVAWQAIPFSQVSEERYLAAAADHIAMLQGSKGQPGRVVLLGGSGVAFSISAEQLGETLGRPVYNGGIQASIGFRNLTDLYLPHLDPEKDTIVIVPELQLIDLDERYTSTYCDVVFLLKRVDLLANRPRCVPQIIHRTWSEIRYHAQGIEASNPIYRRSGFNEVGDLTSHLTVDHAAPDLRESALTPITKERLARFEAYVRNTLIAQGFDVVVIPAAVPEAICDRDSSHFQKILDRLDRLNGPRALKPDGRDFCLAETLFFDGAIHLDAGGRKIQTASVRRYLGRFFENVE
ncbi:hypothetical protein [Pseudoblastomonas halimionae]|uniref:SGNH/GDSL hydrolase family protein n=1 Tax=Alteriqipengyuania halimionae TaxID=1926630 RepID=A0A6I4U475_9SPHN|nr:hypothetical protein [Alteriqipengyuania halimionae]MXP10909.1 hypothetical protein [Alteriqipengyuania halimionae]